MASRLSVSTFRSFGYLCPVTDKRPSNCVSTADTFDLFKHIHATTTTNASNRTDNGARLLDNASRPSRCQPFHAWNG